MTIILEYEKANPCDFGPDTIIEVIEIKEKELKKAKKKTPKKLMEVITEVKQTLYDNGKLVVDKIEDIKIF